MKLCMGCMREIEDRVTSCPYCGFDETNLKQESYYLAPGTVVGGKYIVGRVLKYNGYTIRYLGMNAEKNQKVMIHEYLPSDFSTRSDGETEVTIYSGDALEQFNQGLMVFLNESSRIQQLGSVKGIARVYDCVAENDTGYVVSEYLQGTTLKERLDRGKRYAPAEARDIVASILVGLEQVHSSGIIHCDIAPDNIFVTNEGEAKLLDFGSARYVTTANSKSLAIIIKQGYAPEEQYRSKGQRGTWTDVYALGAVMYRMITGKEPVESVDRALEDTLEEPSKLAPDIPAGIANAVMNALNVYQKDRTATAKEFYQELYQKDTKRRAVKKKKNDAKLPVWLKGLVAALACVIIAGGVILYYSSQKDKDYEVKGTVEEVFHIGIGDTYGKFRDNWRAYGFSRDNLAVEYCYDAAAEEDKDIVKEFIDQTKEGELVEGTRIANIKDKDKVKGKVIVASSKKYTFLEEWQQEWQKPDYVYESADKDTRYDERLCPVKETLLEDSSNPYGMIASITYKEKEIYSRGKGWQNAKEFPNDLDVGDSLAVKVYTGEYYRLKKKQSQEYKSLGYQGRIVSAFQKFEYGTDSKGWKEGSLRTGYYDQAYYSFTEAVGTIAEVKSQALAKGNSYDSRKETKAFDTVGRKLDYGKVTVGDLRVTYGCTPVDGNGKPYTAAEDKYLVYKVKKPTFRRGSTVTVVSAQAPATPTPVVTPKSVQKERETEYHAPAVTPKSAVKSTPKPKATPKSKNDYNLEG